MILERDYADYRTKAEEDEKLALIVVFMDEYGYEPTFSNHKFYMFECKQ